MKKTYITPSVETLEINMEAHIMGASKVKIVSDEADGGEALSSQKIWGNASMWNEE